MSEFPQTDFYDKVRSLGLPPDELIVTGSKAIEAVVGPDLRRGDDIDIAVTDEVYGTMQPPESQ